MLFFRFNIDSVLATSNPNLASNILDSKYKSGMTFGPKYGKIEKVNKLSQTNNFKFICKFKSQIGNFEEDEDESW
jgi:hypothetical protein